MELVGHCREQKVHGPQTQDREHIAGQHNERVRGDRENRRDRIDRKNHIRQGDQADHHEQRGSDFFAVFDGPEILAVVVFTHRQDLAQQLERRVVVQIRFLACGPPHLHTREDQESAEHVEHPVKFGQQPTAHQNHDGAQHDGPDDADHQHAFLEIRGDSEVGEYHQEDKDVVHRQ